MCRKSKCRILLGLVARRCVLSKRSTLSPGIRSKQCKQFCTKTLKSFAIAAQSTYFLISPSVASYALCAAERHCASTGKSSCSSTSRSGIYSVSCIILTPLASVCSGGSYRRAVILLCWPRSYSYTALVCASRIIFFDGNSTVS
jgi:hypothetical protein